jgi:glucosamine-6-phosphate deaminase
MWPASFLQLHRRGIIVCDEDAVEELKTGTVRYWKALNSRLA